jgi:hypothetical protein
VSSKALAAAAVLLLAACSGDDDTDDATGPTIGEDGCPVPAAIVAEAVGHAVEAEPDGERSCAYVAGGDAGAGGRVEVHVSALADEPYGDVLAEAERRAGPTVDLDDGEVDDAERGWVATVGRAVQLGAADSETLVVVAVVDPLLDAEGARDVADRLASEVLG